MTRVALYPFFIGAWFVFVQWRQAGAPAVGRLVDLASSLLAALFVAGLGAGLGHLTARTPSSRGIVALVVVVWGALFGSFGAYLPLAGIRLPIGDTVLAWIAICAFAVLLARRAVVGEGFNRALTIGSAILVLFQGAQLLNDMRAAHATTEAIAEATARSASSATGRSPAHPDIYLFVLDKYGASRWLAEYYGVDNRPFEDSLRQLGFKLPLAARTNYPHTSLVLASLLDGALVHESIGDSTAKWAAVFERIQRGRMIEAVRAEGYRFAFFPTTFAGTSGTGNADMLLTRASAERVAALQSWRVHAPFDALLSLRCGRRGCHDARGAGAQGFPYPLESAAAIRWKFETVRTLPDSSGPIFAFVHVLLPHEPFQFDASCAPIDPWWPRNDAEVDTATDARIREAYAAQVACVNQLVLATARALVERSTTPPVILIQSDHGHARLTEDAMSGRTRPLAALSVAQLRERLDVFAAYRVPGHDSIFPEDVTPASVLPRTLNALFSLSLRIPDDRTWWVDAFNQPLRVTPLSADQLRLSTDAPPSP